MGQTVTMQTVLAPELLSIIDIGANLTSASFNTDLDDVIQRAKNHSVNHIIVTGTNLEESFQAAELCEQYPEYLFSTAGCHPHYSKNFKASDLDQFKLLSQKKQVVAIGECGLDFNRNFSPQDVQLDVFKQQLELAIEVQLPVFLHQRDAHDEFLSILEEYRSQLTKVVVHCFTEGVEALNDYLDLDCYIGVTGWVCDESRGSALRKAVPVIPDNRLLIETDAPYLFPKTIKPKPKKSRNEPMNLLHVCEAVANLRNQQVAEVAISTFTNSCDFFNLKVES